jgi:hypothetical protein
MPAYLIYGLRVESALALAGAGPPVSGGTPDAVVRPAAVDGRPASLPVRGARFAPAGGGVGLAWPGVGAFAVRGGAEVLVDAAPGADGGALETCLLGPVLATLLHQRGHLVLHASAVAIGGAAVGFAGESGAGKSTTAAALHARGHPLVTDDLLVLLPGGDGEVLAAPGLPRLRLRGDAAALVGPGPRGPGAAGVAPARPARPGPAGRPGLPGDGEPAGPRRAGADGAGDKRPWPARTVDAGRPLPLGRLYALRPGPAVAAPALRPPEALLALLRESYCAPLLDRAGREAHFLACARVAARVPVHALARPGTLAALGAVADLVEAGAGPPGDPAAGAAARPGR